MDGHKAITFSYADIVKNQIKPVMVPKQKSPSWFDQIMSEDTEKIVSLVRIIESFAMFHSLSLFLSPLSLLLNTQSKIILFSIFGVFPESIKFAVDPFERWHSRHTNKSATA